MQVQMKSAKAIALTILATAGLVVEPTLSITTPTVHAAGFITGSSAYQAVAPSRLADTRADEGASGFTRISDTIVRVKVAGRGGVPDDASAAVLNVTGVNTSAPGFITVFPSGTVVPTASNVNFDGAGQVMANMVTVKLGAGGSVDVYMQRPMDVVVDVSGAYVPVRNEVASGRLVTRSDGAYRVLDTRERAVPVGVGGVETVDVSSAGVPPDAIAVVVNLTATEAAVGFWTAYPVGPSPRPKASNINIDTPGQTRAGQAIVLLSPGSRVFNVFSMGGGHLIVDVAGWFTGASATPSTDGLFFPSNPTRLLDSRTSYALPTWGGTTLEFPVYGPPAGQVSAVAVNITGTESMLAGFVTAFPSGVPRPEASNLNVDTWDQTVANHAVVRASSRGISLFTQRGLHMIADLNGWFLGPPTAAVLPPPSNPDFGRNTAQAVNANAIGMFTGVGTGGNLDAVANLGLAATWNGAAELAVPGNIVLFGHRTTHGAPFRYINSLPFGAVISLIGDDGHSYNYMVVRQDVTIPHFGTIYSIGRDTSIATVQLVACTPPGSVRFRVVTTARLISVT